MNRSSTDPGRWKTGLLGRSAARLLGDERGQELVEFAVLLPVLLLLLLGIVEFGNSYDVLHTMTSVSREGANIAARGEPLDGVLDVVMVNGGDIGLSENGGAVVTRVTVVAGAPMVTEQAATTGYAEESLIGEVGLPASGFDDLVLSNGESYHVVEIFYSYELITPLRNLITAVSPPDVFYQRAIF